MRRNEASTTTSAFTMRPISRASRWESVKRMVSPRGLTRGRAPCWREVYEIVGDAVDEVVVVGRAEVEDGQ